MNGNRVSIFHPKLVAFTRALFAVVQISIILFAAYGQPSGFRIASASGWQAPSSQTLTSLLGLDDLARQTANRIDQALAIAQGALHDELEQLHADVTDIINQLNITYKDLLNVSISSLDTETQRVATLLSNQLQNIIHQIDSSIKDAPAALLTVVQSTRTQLSQLTAQLEASLANVIAFTTSSVTYILDRAAWNTIGTGAVLILLAGIAIILVVVVKTKGWPTGPGGVIAGFLLVLFIVGGSALSFVPTVKAQALKAVGKGMEVPTIPLVPRIFELAPNPVILGQTTELNILGTHLILDGETPVVTIDGVEAAIRATGEERITVAVPTEGQSRTVQLTLTYTLNKQSVGEPLELRAPTPIPQPALISLTNFNFSPSNPIATRDIVYATVTVTNSGDLPSNEFTLTWIPMPGQGTYTATITSLTAHETRNVTIPQGFTYPQGGVFSTSVQSNSTQMGSNPTALSGQIIVQTPPPIPPPIPITTSEVFTVNAYAASSAVGECKSIDTTRQFSTTWTIDRSQGDPGHPGISEISNDSNRQANDTLRSYNYQPVGDHAVSFTGRICGAGLWGPGAIFQRTYRVYLIQP